jgi:hypothetical protein
MQILRCLLRLGDVIPSYIIFQDCWCSDCACFDVWCRGLGIPDFWRHWKSAFICV